MDELTKLLEVEISRLEASPYLNLTDGWADSVHYSEGFVAGQLDVLIRLRELIERIA